MAAKPIKSLEMHYTMIQLLINNIIMCVHKKHAVRMVLPNTRVFLCDFMTLQENQILARAIEIQKENWEKPQFFSYNQATIIIL